MNEREKAIEALKRLYKSHDENYFAPFPTRSDLDTIRSIITQPTLDDAIKLVENMKNDWRNNVNKDVNVGINIALTALKGLKEGK